MSLNRSITLSEAIAIDAQETEVTYSSPFAFTNYNSARRFEAKINITAGESDAEIVATLQTSDDGLVWFDVPTVTVTITGVAKWVLATDVRGNRMRVKYTFTKGAEETINTAGTLFLLVR